MIEYDEARRLMLRWVEESNAERHRIAEMRKDLTPREREILHFGSPDDDLNEVALIEDATISGDFGWVFFYQSKKYLESQDFSDRLAGNAPIIISKLDGSLHVTGTGRPIEYYIENFVRTGSPHGEDCSG